MADLTGVFSGTGISKGQSNVITLDKAALKALFTETYYNDISNWKQVVGAYKNSIGQTNNLLFDAREASPAADFNPTATSLDGAWEIQSITIIDHDKGYYKLQRSDLTTGDFDILLGPAATQSPFSQTLRQTTDTSLSNNYLTLTFPTASYGIGLSSNSGTYGSDKLYAEFTLDAVDSNIPYFGFYVYADTPTDFDSQRSDSSVFVVSAVNGNAMFGWEFASGSPAFGEFSSFSATDVIGIAIDTINERFYVSKNGVWSNSSNPALGTGGFDYTATSSVNNGDDVYFGAFGRNSAGLSLNETPTQTVPSGYILI